MSLKRHIIKIPILGKGLIILFRFKIAIGYYANPIKQILLWLLRSNEITNFTYDLSPINKQYLISYIAVITGKNVNEIEKYITEVENDVELKNHITNCTKQSAEQHISDLDPKYGRRIGWYATIRAKKPKIVIETGVDKGLGSCILTAALIKNTEEGYPGRYYGTDINHRAGYLLKGKYADFGEILYGDSIESLKKFNGQIDVFINDSDHSSEYEWKEYQIIKNKLSDSAIILGDNSHTNTKLLQFSMDEGRKFLFFQEKPSKHWYPGGGIGASYT